MLLKDLSIIRRKMMNLIEFIEKVSNIKLLPHQKTFVKFLEKHPNAVVVMTRKGPVYYENGKKIERGETDAR